MTSTATSRLTEQRAWYVYDWANSAFVTTSVTLLLGPWMSSIAKNAADASGLVHPLGIPVDARSYWPYLVSLSVFSQVLLLPLLGAVADYGRRKRMLLAAFAWMGAAAAMAMFFVDGTRYLLGGALFLIANLCFGASAVIYNAFLPEIADASERDSVSSKGWGIGYLGGGLLLAMNLLLFAKAESLGISAGLAVRINLFSAGAWWALFTTIPVWKLRDREGRSLPPGSSYLRTGVEQLIHTVRDVRHYRHTIIFLLAYLIYNDGIQTVIVLAAAFGQEELKLPMATITSVILLVQFVAFGGAMAFNWLAARFGNKNAVMLGLAVWTATLVYIYALVSSEAQFYVMGVIVGLVLGGTQALSRSLYSFLIPKGREAEYFSLYEVSDKGTSWLGPLVFGLGLQLTGSYRVAILSLIVFFAIGMALLSWVNVRQGAVEAGNEPPVR
jgi:UMF1 family MFS transporter